MAGNGIRATLMAAVAILLASAPVHAQGRSRTIRQSQHTTWTARDGAPPEIWSMDQGPDGFLWLGTGSGLYRFDGISFERFQPVRGEQLASIDITAVRVLPSKEIWIGYSDGGVSRLKDGHVTNFTDKDGMWPGMVLQFHQDADGVLWAASHGGLSRFQGGRWRRVGADWNLPPGFTVGLFVARDGSLWVSTEQHIYVLRPGSQRFEQASVVTESATLAQTPDGRIWIADRLYGLRPLPNYAAGERQDPWALRSVPPDSILSVAHFAVDRQGVIWGTDRVNGGVFRFDPLQDKQRRQGLNASDMDVFRHADGLTAGRSIPILGDQEGNVWVGTSAGLNRFRISRIVPDAAVPPATAYGYSIAALPDATYITDGVWLYSAAPHESARRVARLPVGANTILLRGRDGALWYANNGFMHRELGGTVSRVAVPPGVRDRAIQAAAVDREGTLWVAFKDAGIYQLKDAAWTGPLALGDLPSPVIAASDSTGAVWFGYLDSRVSRHDAAGMRVYSASDGLHVGNVEGITVQHGVVWVGGELGVARLDGARFHTLGPDRVAPLFGVSGIGRAADGAMLFNGLMGIVQVSEEEVRQSFTDTTHAPAYELYDRRKGVPGVAQQGWHAPTVVPGADGRTWFISNTGVSFLSAGGPERNVVPPPISILSVTAEGVTYSSARTLTLPAGATSLAITYTAAALRDPESVHFRHRLEGLETEWSDVAGRREATYSNLGPGRYRFHVIAANEDGVWNQEGATLDITIPPTFVQGLLFKVLVAIALLTLAWLGYRQRMRAVADRVHSRMTERMEERERIARALHDTLLQSVQAVTLRFQAAVNDLPAGLPARRALEEAIDRADAVIAEGRDRIRNLRVPQHSTVEVVVADIVQRQAFDAGVEVAVTSTGVPRPLDPLVLDEVTRIASEALFNVWRHAGARRVEVQIVHGANFSLRITDDGVGIDPDIVTRGQREGHFGLPGMRESARKLHAALVVRRSPGGGSEVSLVVPASIAYRS